MSSIKIFKERLALLDLVNVAKTKNFFSKRIGVIYTIAIIPCQAEKTLDTVIFMDLYTKHKKL